ncbi:DUF3285 domain-containing protein [Pseudanabaena sp. Chao 1811]|uniref:DUF3285 domain-containing protein n=1 Tax=Pseudanabaena sp. Chao 1811 TaxID=2963092 RepID=UPI0022F38F2D|nr:DUF3285 domain-containing protein [Pseudanabaena sp. Chao 1811]
MNSDLNTESNIPSNNSSNTISKQSTSQPQDSFVKIAMRNMVKKGSTSLFHFSLTIFGVVATLLVLAIIFH